MIIGEIRIDTTWAASTSFIPFPPGYHNAQDYQYQGVVNRGIYATTAYVTGVWEKELWDDAVDADMLADPTKYANPIGAQMEGTDPYGTPKSLRGLAEGRNNNVCNAYDEGTVLEVKVRKLKALKLSPNRSGIQVNRQLLQGNKLVFRYVAHGELTRPL